MQRTRCSAGTRNPPSPPPTVILISWQQGAELGHPHYWTIQIRSFSPAFINYSERYHLDESFCKTCGHLCTHARPRTHTHMRTRVEWQMCEEEAKVSVMDRREGCCSNPASFLLYLSHWPVVVASRPCCVHGEWPDLILDCLAVSGGVEGWGFPTWHLSNSGGSSTGKPIMALVGLDCSLEPSRNQRAHRRAQQTSPLGIICHVQNRHAPLLRALLRNPQQDHWAIKLITSFQSGVLYKWQQDQDQLW